MLGRRLLQAGARAHLRCHPGPHGAGRGHRRGDRDRRAQALRGARAGRRPVDLHLPAGQHALDRQRAPLRRDRRGARAAAPAHRGGRGDRGHRLLGARGRQGGRRRGGAAGVRRGRAPDGRHHGAAARAAGQGAGPDRGAGPARLAHHGRRHRLPRAGPDPARLPALLAQHRGRPSRHGQDQLRARGPGQRRDGGAAAGAPLLPRDGPPGADPAPPGLGGGGQRAEPADRPDPQPGLEQDRDGRDPAVRRAHLHRRQPQRHGHGHPGPGAAPQEVRG